MTAFSVFLAATFAAVHGVGLFYALRAAERAHTAQGGLAWALGLVFLPWLALPAYAILRPPKVEELAENLGSARRSALERFLATPVEPSLPRNGTDAWRRTALERLGPLSFMTAPPPTLLVDGDAAFEAIFAAIDAAERYILVEFYIVRDDDLGRRLAERLSARAREGLRVCLLYDRVGSHRAAGRYWNGMREAGVEVRPFEVTRPLERVLRLNYRNHRKIVVADGRIAFIGGPNVGDEYLGLDRRFGPWRDTSVMLSGAAASAVEAVFLEDWIWTGGTHLAREPAPAEEDPGAAKAYVPILILPTGPADPLPACTLFFCHLIAEARERVWIASPYFVPDLDVLTALKLAALRGVDVRILIPDRPDHLIVWLAAFGYAEEALRAGIKLFRYEAGFIHQKVCLVDDWGASVGTVNLDNRSLRLNFEVSAVVFDEGFAGEVEAMLKRDFARSRLYDAEAHAARSPSVRVLGPAARLLGPIL
jgi:cardiolipin synthase